MPEISPILDRDIPVDGSTARLDLGIKISLVSGLRFTGRTSGEALGGSSDASILIACEPFQCTRLPSPTSVDLDLTDPSAYNVTCFTRYVRAAEDATLTPFRKYM
jgi:hypothetical protein